MKKLELTRNDITPLALLLIGFSLLLTGIFLKSLIVIAGVSGLVIAWFLCIDAVIANHKMNNIKRVIFGSIIVFVPMMFALYLGS